MKENNMMSYEMYEDFKETMVKTIKTNCRQELQTIINRAIMIYPNESSKLFIPNKNSIGR